MKNNLQPLPHRQRRPLARVFLAAALLFIGAHHGAIAGVNEASYEVLENGAGKFKIDIQGCPVASANVESIMIDDIVIGVVDVTRKGDYMRTYAPGDAHYGNITIRCRVTRGNELFDWWLDAARGDSTRKSMSVIALGRDGAEARRWNVINAFPVRWDPGEYSPSSNVAVETIVAKMQRVELAIAPPGGGGGQNPGLGGEHAQRPGGPPQPGFTVEISGAGSGSEPDSAWETCTGGALNIEIADSSTGTDQSHTTTPGHKYVDTLTLRGPLTSGRQAMAGWITETIQGKSWERNVTLTETARREDTGGRTFTYLDCFPTRYVFPAFSASETGSLSETIEIQPNRLELPKE